MIQQLHTYRLYVGHVKVDVRAVDAIAAARTYAGEAHVPAASIIVDRVR